MDEKGRLFGKLNIIDLLVILLVIAAVVLFFLRRNQPGGTEEPKFELVYQVQVPRIEPEVYEQVKQFVDPQQGLSDQMFSSDTSKLVDAIVEDCTASPHVEYVTTSDGQIKRAESSGDDQRLDLIFTIRAWSTDPMSNKVATQQVRLGITHYIKTVHFEFVGSIIAVDRIGQ